MPLRCARVTTDELVDEIFGRCRERIERGESVDVHQIVRAHPDLADALRERFAAARLLDRAAAKSRREDADAATRVGSALGPYRIESLLGAGGMGTVYLACVETATDALPPGARVAVKVFHPHLITRERFAARFRREAELGRRVRHENVVRTLDAGETPEAGRPVRFLVMEHVEGRTLRDLLAENGRLPEELVRHVGREVAKGLAAIHAAGAIHRDLKPENVIITREHAVKVMDLGVAHVDDAATLSETGAFVGSLRYGAPEQIKSRGKVDHRVDLHALGLVLYELATGAHPFAGDEFPDVVRQILDVTPGRCGELVPQLSPFLEELVARLLEKDREQRPSAAGDVVRILEEGESSAWWKERSAALRRETRRPIRRIRIPRETALHGRETEIARLREAFAKARSGDGQVVLVEGEAGIGKSRLVDDFVMSLWTGGEEVDFLFGSYPPGGAASSAGAFSTAYRAHLGDDEAALREALPQTPSLVPAFAALLRGELPPDGAERLTTDSIQTLFVHMTRALAARRTTIVLIDDLHFAPEEGRSLFLALALAAPGHRILLVGGARPSLDEKWAAAVARLPHASRLALARLSPKVLVALLNDALRSEHLATELAGKIGEKSDGNPFFVFEILRGLREGNFLTKRPDGTWITTRAIREIEVPPSIVEVIQARVSDLHADERNALEVAACVGFEFDAALVGAVLGVEPIPLLQRLGRIEKRHRLVRSVGHLFGFDHHQVQEVLYAGLSPPLREAYHAAIADAIETRSGAASREPKDIDGALCVDLAGHFLEGAQGRRALRYLDAALAHLETRWLNDAAVRLVERALASPGLVAGDSRCDLRLRESVRLHLLGRRDAERAAIEEALALADAGGDARRRVRARIKLGLHLWRVALYAEAQRTFGEALDLARGAGDSQGEAWATGNLGNILQAVGRYADAQALYERNLALALQTGDRQDEAYATGNLGNAFLSLGRNADAQALFERDLALERQIGNRPGEALASGNLGVAFRALGRHAAAKAQQDRHLALVREIGDRRGETLALVNLGSEWLALGDARRAHEALDAALALCREIGVPWAEANALAILGQVADEASDPVRALAWTEESLALHQRIGNGDGAAASMILLGDLRRRAGDAEGARTALEEAASLARAQGSSARTALALAILACLPGGDSKAAEAAFADAGEALDMAEAAQARLLLWQATRDRAHLAEAKRVHDFLVENAPPECRESMLTNVRLHREIVSAWRAEFPV
jgi:serine/threonine protein kinase/tetratricopeptide (TPR) repeat protein